MIGIVDVEIQAANPQMPLYPMRAFVNSPSSVRVRNVPTEVGAWKITSVRVVVAYPDSSIKTADCVLAGSVWVATVAGCAVSGKTENGFTVFASGVDENGNAVANYVLGKGDVEVLKADGTLSPDAPAYYVHLLEEEPDAPNEGDMWPTAAGFVIWQDGEARALGGGSSVSVVPPSPSAQAGQAADAKATGDALWTGFTEWAFSDGLGHSMSIEEYNGVWRYSLDGFIDSMEAFASDTDALAALSLTFVGDNTITATRHLITPTKTSQLTNDGAPNGGGMPYATTNQIPDVTGKADKVAGATAGNLAALNAQGNLADSGTKPSDFATKADLPYALVTPGEWEFGGDVYQGDNYTVEITGPVDGYYTYNLMLYTDRLGSATYTTDDVLSIPFGVGPDAIITATRASLPGHLIDRAGNRVVVSGDTTLTLPALEHAGRLRDFLVRLEISGSTVPTITFAAPTGETVTYETDGDEFPVPDEAGTWSYSFTENCVAHKFAVSLKKVNEVAAPQAQGGS